MGRLVRGHGGGSAAYATAPAGSRTAMRSIVVALVTDRGGVRGVGAQARSGTASALRSARETQLPTG